MEARDNEAGFDLGKGVPLAQLEEDQPFSGQVDGEEVVLVRRGTEVFAISARCSHYGGPLAKGLVVGETIRCPWHHAVFALGTGEALGAPALNPIPCWKVEVRDGTAFVGARRQAGPLESFGREAGIAGPVVVIGAGAAGSAAAETLRREGYRGVITLVDPDSAAPYDRPNLSKDFLAGDASEEWIPLRPPGFYEEHAIDRVVAAAASIDVERRQVELTDGRRLGYQFLLLATGASPTKLDVPGANLPHVHLLRSLNDCRSLIATAERAQRAVVLGASFIGMEAAASLRSRSLDVVVVAPGTVPFEHTLGPELGRRLQRAHEQNGVRFLLGRKVAAVEKESVILDDGTRLPAELVVVGIGVKPNTALAETAGLRVEGGVVVNELLESSQPGIFAAGDIALYPDPYSGRSIRVEHWVAAQRQGQSAARNIVGRNEPFTDPPFFWTRQGDVAVAYVGNARKWDEVRVEGDLPGGDAAVRYLEGGAVRALATMGRDLENLRAEAALEAAVLERDSAEALADL